MVFHPATCTSQSLRAAKIFPSLAIDMIEVGESTGALPAMLSSVAEFYEDDVSTRVTAMLSLVEPAIMICMGIFVAFVLVSLYLPIFSLQTHSTARIQNQFHAQVARRVIVE